MNEWYDKEEDIFNIELTDSEYWKTIELANGINIDLDKNGKIKAIEIMQASKIFSGDIKKVIESVSKQVV